MATPSPSNGSGHARRLLVTLVITTAAAAVTAGVALQKRQPAEAVVQAAEASPLLAGATPTTPAAAVTRRERWRDPWKRPAPLSESAPTSIHEPLDAPVTPSDPSLPAAADVLRGAAGTAGEVAPTF